MQLNRTKQSKRPMALWMLAGAIAGSIPMAAPSVVNAADRRVEAQQQPGELSDVAADKAPAAVVAAVKTEAPDGSDIVYSKATGKDGHYRVGVTIPSGIRLRLLLKEDGTALKPAELAENQPKGAPKGKDVREKLLADYEARAVAARAAKANPAVAVVPPAPVVPPVPAVPPTPVVPPAPVVPPVPPVAVQPPATPAMPAVPTLPGNPPEVNGVRAANVAVNDIPDAPRQALLAVAGKDKGATYSKQIRDGNKVYYGVEYKDGGKEMWVRVNDAGKTVAGPVLAEGKASDNDAKPAAGKLPAADVPNGAVKLADLPKAVQATVTQHTLGGKNVVTTKYTDDGKTVYRVNWADATGDKHEMRVGADGNQIVEKGATPAKTPAKK